MMTKKHFQTIADILRVNTHTAQKAEMHTYISTWAIEELISYFSEINPSFDAEKFRYISEFNQLKQKKVA